MNNKLKTISNLFEGNKIRSIWDSEKEEYFYSVVDVIGALTDSKRSRKYWNDLKLKLKSEGSQLSEEIGHHEFVFQKLKTLRYFEDGDLWLTQKAIGELFGIDRTVVTKHIRNIYLELDENSTSANFALVQNEGNREIARNVSYYNLNVVISVGYRTNSDRAIQFRRWATYILKEFSKKGYIIDKKRIYGTYILEKFSDW